MFEYKTEVELTREPLLSSSSIYQGLNHNNITVPTMQKTEEFFRQKTNHNPSPDMLRALADIALE